MPETISELMGGLDRDAWRDRTGFSPEIQAVLNTTLKPGEAPDLEALFNGWVRSWQPCLFGRIAAKQGAISYCFVPEAMLFDDERKLKKHIQDARLRWRRAGFEGTSSNFIIVMISEKLTFALPSDIVKKIAIRLCTFYLEEPVESDRVYLDRIYLEMPAVTPTAWEWVAGVNYFSAQGDGRWWQDHRFPAGMAFSINSVGHMAKSGRLKTAVHDLETIMGTALSDFQVPNVDSLEKALELAMMTINKASESVSGRATNLISATEINEPRLDCPIKLSKALSSFDHCAYKGFYHTDYTIPSEYFRPDVVRPLDINPFQLDFTYLFDRKLDNPDFDRMGEGRRIRQLGSSASSTSGNASLQIHNKRLRGEATEVQIADVPELMRAIRLPKKR